MIRVACLLPQRSDAVAARYFASVAGGPEIVLQTVIAAAFCVPIVFAERAGWYCR